MPLSEFRPTEEQTKLFVGREEEMARLRQAMERSFNGKGQVVLIEGVAGIGKSTLARQLIDEIDGENVVVATGRCFDHSLSSPYSPWIEIEHQIAQGEPSAVGTLIRGGIDRASHPQPEDSLYQEVLNLFVEHTQHRAVVILLEDIHWADRPSLDLVRFISPRINDIPVLLLATYRGDEVQREHPLYTLLPSIVRESQVARLALKPLGRDAMRTWIQTVYKLGSADHARLVDYVFRQSEGNPFFAQEILRSLEDNQILRNGPDSTWMLDDIEGIGVPTLLQQVIETRLQAVTDDVREALGVASVIGQEIEVPLWGKVLQVEDDQIVTTVETAIHAGILADAGAVKVQFSHALVRETLYGQLYPARRRIWHQRVAEALIEISPADPDPIAYHLGKAGDPREADWLTDSGDRASRALARLTAAEKYRRAIDLLEGQEGTASKRGWLLFRLAESYRLAAPRQSLQLLEDAAEIANELGDFALAALVQFSQGMCLCLLDYTSGREELLAGDRALDELDQTAKEHIFDVLSIDVEGRKGEVASWLAIFGEYDLAIEIAQQYLDEIISHGAIHRRTEADAWDAIGFARAGQGNPEPAAIALERSIRTFIEQGNYYSAAVSSWEQLSHVVLVYQTDDIPLRNRLAEQARNLWSQSRHGQVAVHPDWAMTPIYLIEGNWNRAVSSATRTLETDAWSVGPLYYLATIARSRGDNQAARLRLSQALPKGAATEPGSTLIYNAMRFQCLGADLALDDGDIEGADDWAESLRTWIDWSGHLPGESYYHALKSQIARQQNEMEQALSHAQNAYYHAERPRQPLALVNASRLLGELHTLVEDFDRAREYLEEAEGIARACHAQLEIALILLSRAELIVATRSFPAARTRLRESREILEGLGATPQLDRLSEIERLLGAIGPPSQIPGGLTNRELEVLQIVADGYTDAAAATRLGISPRTVSNHLSSIYAKLGVTSRAAATRFAVENGLTSADKSG